MNLTTELLHIVERAHSLPGILDAAVRMIAERLLVDGCSVFLEGPHGELVRRAAHGTSASEDAPAESLAARVSAERRVARVVHVASEPTSLLAAAMLLRGNRLGALVVQSAGQHDFSTQQIETLVTLGAQLAGIVENARVVDALDRDERPHGLPSPHVAPPSAGERLVRGIAASPGIAIGDAVFRGVYRLDRASPPLPAGEPEAERARVRVAIDKAHNDLLRLQAAAEREIDEEHALIFAAHLLLIADPKLVERIDQEIARGLDAPHAVEATLDELEMRLRLVPDPYIQEKVDDIDDLRSRLLRHLLDPLESTRHERASARIVMTRAILPSLVVELKSEGVQALVTETGSATSHGVLLARAMGIPVVTGVSGMLDAVRPGDRLIVDGTSGFVLVRPSKETLARYEEERRRMEHVRTHHARLRDVLTRTADGVRVTLHANVGLASDLTVARENGAEGIGLYRTEFPFIVRNAFPTLGEQVRIYDKAYELFPTGPIQFRILDLAGDKFMATAPAAMGRSAFHGYRSIRVLFDHPDVLRDQVQALAIAARERPLRILIPMVTSLEDLRRVKTMIRQALASLDAPNAQRAPQIGAMIEVPGAVELAGDIASEVDFLSIGTNDLMQYALVVDRDDARMAQMSDPHHPAMLRMIARVVAAAHAAGKPVGVCGEIVVRPEIALALIALGVDSLSVVPTAIPELKHALTSVRLEPMRAAIPSILQLSDARSIAVALRAAQSE